MVFKKGVNYTINKHIIAILHRLCCFTLTFQNAKIQKVKNASRKSIKNYKIIWNQNQNSHSQQRGKSPIIFMFKNLSLRFSSQLCSTQHLFDVIPELSHLCDQTSHKLVVKWCKISCFSHQNCCYYRGCDWLLCYIHTFHLATYM